MLNFTKKNLQGSERVCFRLQAIREAKGLTLEYVAEQTKINKTYLIALEECRFEDIPFSSLYQKNFIKKYAGAIGENPESFISQFCIEEMEPAAPRVIPNRKHWLFFTAWPSVMRAVLLGSFALMLTGYLGWQIRNTISPPALSLVSPDNGYITRDNTITLRGASEPATTIMINGQGIRSDDFGNFTEAIALNPGVNTIVIEAKKKHGKSTQTTRHIVYKEPSRLSSQADFLEAKN